MRALKKVKLLEKMYDIIYVNVQNTQKIIWILNINSKTKKKHIEANNKKPSKLQQDIKMN